MKNENSCDVGLVGLAVMGQNLALNIADHGYRIAVYNRTAAVTEKFIAENPANTKFVISQAQPTG